MNELEVRLAALSKLVKINSTAVDARLSEEMRRVEKTLLNATDYDELDGALKTLAVLAPRFHAAVVPLIASFSRSVVTRTLTQHGEPLPEARLRYRSASHLVKEAVDAARTVAYAHTAALVDLLCELDLSPAEEIRGKAASTIEGLAEFDLNIFYGEGGVGAQPQATLVEHLAQLKDQQLVASVGMVLRALGRVLSPTLEGRAWTYNKVVFTRGGIVSGGGVADMRASAVALLKRMYPLSVSVSYRKRVLGTLDSATRRENPSTDSDTVAMFERDALEVLHFLRDLVHTEALPLVQSIEHQAYWDYYHATTEAAKTAALEVRAALESHHEYQIYKQLIGFEGIFGRWEDLTRSDDAWDYSNAKRVAAMRSYLDQINAQTYDTWRDRILEFSKTESDDMATFPVFYEFLEVIGREQPRMAMELVLQHEERMSAFLIPLVGGLWQSSQQAGGGTLTEQPQVDASGSGAAVVTIESVVAGWIEAGIHLAVIAKSIFKGGVARLGVLAAVVERAAADDDQWALVNSMGVAATLYPDGGGEQAKTVFMRALRVLAEHGSARWASTVWYSRPFVAMVAGMDAGERAEILASMELLPKLEYESEQVLKVVGEQDAGLVLNFLLRRIDVEKEENSRRRGSADSGLKTKDYEAIPHHLHNIGKLVATVPERLVAGVRARFDLEQAAFFPYDGSAQLLKGVFPNFDSPLQSSLIGIIDGGDAVDLAFAVGVVRAFGGGAPVQDVCRAIVKKVPENSKTWNELWAALASTGVVMGEFGLAEAMERKRDEFAPWARDDDARVRAFGEWVADRFERSGATERQRANEELELRKYRYGSDDESS
jgi:hypothetical protein